MSNATPPPPGWYPDRTGRAGDRWWDGQSWTAHTRTTTAAVSPRPFSVAEPPAPPAAPARYGPPASVAPSVQPGAAMPHAQPGPVVPYAQPAPVMPYAQPGAVVPRAQPGSVQPHAAPPVPIGVWRGPVDTRPVVTGMGSALRNVFAKYAAFDGRASRPEFWYLYLFNVLIAAGVMVLFLLGALWPPLLIIGIIGYFGLIAWGLVLLVPWLALAVRRLRDAGFHWAWLFLALVPFGGLALLVMYCQPSKYP